GINLHRANVIVNYDSPWNATRLMQRIGRVNRIGSTAKAIYNYTFYPSDPGDSIISLKKNSLIKLQSFHSALGEDTKIYSHDEIVKEFRLFNSDVRDDTDRNLELLRDVRALHDNNPTLYRRIKQLPPKSRCARASETPFKTIAYLASETKTAYYLVDEQVRELSFLEAADIFRADPSEKAVPFGDSEPRHYEQVKRAMMQYTVKSIPEPPQVTNAEICYGEPSSSVSAMGDSESTIVWYSDKQKTDELRKGSPKYSPSVSSIGAYNYYATQIVDDCESQPSEAIYTIKALPSPPITLSQLNICEYDSAPTLRVAGENIKWYAADKTTKIADGDSFINDDMSVGLKRFYATQTINGCEGTPTTITYVVNAQPSDPIVTGASMCAGDTLIPSLTTNLSIDKWYSDINATDESYKATGYNYTPNYEDVSATTTFYVLREQNSCLSNIIPVELKVIQQPNFSIGENIISCIYDSVKTIEATDFEPAINENSYIGWTIATKKENSAYPDNSEHAITPSDLINEVGTFTISAY
ncbi:MAG: hypothetical protein II630_01385, partial [Bacteroidales bacterium]|nr:hypothetical protein [Bacteroidales bacterium]